MTARSITRLLAASATVALLAILTPSPARAAPTPQQSAQESAQDAATWLATLMTDGHFEPPFPGVPPDAGISIDALFAYAAAGTPPGAVDDVADWLSDPAVLSLYAMNFTSGFHAGPTAKVLLALEIAGAPTTVAGVGDLEQSVRDQLTTTGPHAGLFENPDPAVGNHTNMFDQSLAILALARTSGGVPPSAVDFVLGTQCPDHGFPLYVDEAECVSSVDSTAMVVQALVAAGQPGAAGPAVGWLLSVQNADGGFKDYLPPGTPGEIPFNSNSTGIAGAALFACGAIAGGDKAVQYIQGLQVGDDGAQADHGAIAYRPFDPSNVDDPGGLDSRAPRATAQAILALARLGLNEVGLAEPGSTPQRAVCLVAPPPPAEAFLPQTGDPVRPIAITGAVLVLTGVTVLIGLRWRRRPVPIPAGRD